MDLMSIRRGMMAQMVGGNRFAFGAVTVEETTTTLSINLEFAPRCFILLVSERTLEPNIRNFGGISHIENNGSIYEVGVSSNTTGSSWGGATALNVGDTINQPVVTINGTQVNISGISSARFIAGRTYNWFAYT